MFPYYPAGVPRTAMPVCAMLLILACVRALPYSQEARAQTVAIKGKVTLSTGDVPTVAQVTVGNQTVSKQVSVGDDGTYAISDLPPGTYSLAAFGGTLQQVGRFSQTGIEIRSDTVLPLTIDIVMPATPTGQ